MTCVYDFNWNNKQMEVYTFVVFQNFCYASKNSLYYQALEIYNL